ncbi:MAG TPA: nickel pincer cofactor biosynthesis protein LarB [Thermomicrobiales bacterium]|nr:nickel pincer cofactor biosynthesis protein LarB [Thermomicrobiales bacterium]
MSDPFADVVMALQREGDGLDRDGEGVRVDAYRQTRTGIPEVVFASHKRLDALVASIARLLDANGRAMVSRIQSDQWETVARFERDGFEVERFEAAAVAIIRRSCSQVPVTGGRIAVIAAGSSDRAVAEEAAVMAQEMGVEVFRATDVGVAGLHRLVRPLRDIAERDADCIVVAAGMDGALPSVVAGLVDVPVIGLPVSVGYGHGGNGEAALMTMLQSCAPGITVVNIDNGIGAGSTAALIANRVAAARDGRHPMAEIPV